MSRKILATLSLALFACGSPEAINRLDCEPKIMVGVQNHLITFKDTISFNPEILQITWHVPAWCPPAKISTLKFGTKFNPDFEGTTYYFGLRTSKFLAYPAPFGCYNSYCKGEFALQEPFVLVPDEFHQTSLTLSPDGNTTITPQVNGITWSHDRGGVNNTIFTPPLENGQVQIDLTNY